MINWVLGNIAKKSDFTGVCYHEYNKPPEKFINTDRFSHVGNIWSETGEYFTGIPHTEEWMEFWSTEKKKSLYGVSVEVEPDVWVYITGFHYFYLNFCPIDRLVHYVDEETGEERVTPKVELPAFYDGDWEYFQAVEQAMKYGKHMVVLKARRKGFSYKAAAMLNRNYFLKKGSKSYVVAAEKEFLIGDGLLTKAWDMMAHIDKNTAWTQPKLSDTIMHKRSGYKQNINGTDVEVGYKSQIIGITLKNDVQKIRGKAGELMFFEEAGKFPDITQAWDIAWPTMTQGTTTRGLMVAFGTGGTEGANFEGLEQMFNQPDAYHCYPFKNVWDEGMADMDAGWFVPDYVNLDGFIDKWGNSLRKEATEFRLTTRASRKKANDPKALDQHIAEHPFTPREAVLQIDANQFPIAELESQKAMVLSRGLQKAATNGYMYRDSETKKAEFKVDPDRKPITIFPHKKAKDVDLNGAIQIFETPYRDDQGNVPQGMYILMHDPYAQNESGDSSSLGATYVLKRPNRLSYPDDIIVASYVARPATLDEYNYQMFLLAEYYNAKIGFENDRGDVIGFARRHRRLHYLQEEFEMLYKKELASATVNRNYGMHMTTQRKNQGELYIRDWLLTPRGRTVDGQVKLNLHYIYDVALLEELIKFNHQGNFDRVMALMIGMYHMHELTHVPVSEGSHDMSQDSFFDIDEVDDHDIIDVDKYGHARSDIMRS